LILVAMWFGAHMPMDCCHFQVGELISHFTFSSSRNQNVQVCIIVLEIINVTSK
jgi:hypothetical protein